MNHFPQLAKWLFRHMRCCMTFIVIWRNNFRGVWWCCRVIMRFSLRGLLSKALSFLLEIAFLWERSALLKISREKKIIKPKQELLTYMIQNSFYKQLAFKPKIKQLKLKLKYWKYGIYNLGQNKLEFPWTKFIKIINNF